VGGSRSRPTCPKRLPPGGRWCQQRNFPPDSGAQPGYIGIEKVREHVDGMNGGSVVTTLAPDDWALVRR